VTETLLLNVAANQAAVGLQESWELNTQKRIADELEQKVAQQTRELAALLHKIRGSEATLRQVIDTIPTLAWCNLADGSNEFLNKRWHDYTGLSPEASHGWGWQASFHPEDLPADRQMARDAGLGRTG
jgi:PAS domain-containing protein